MNCFFNSLSEGCVNFEKCGDVIVSPKDNMIGMFCHFCSDIYTNLSEFLHHLQWMHNDVLKFTETYNVYSVEELLSSADTQVDVQSQANSSSSSDSGMPADTADATGTTCLNNGISCTTQTDAIASIALNQNILSALASYEVDYQETKASKKTNSPKNVLQWNTEADSCLPVADPVTDVIAEVEAMLLNYEPQADEKTAPKKAKLQVADASDHNLQLEQMFQAAGLVDFELSKPDPVDITEKRNSKRGKPPMETIKPKAEKTKLTCDYKSYAIARSARKREQQQRMQNIKKRIFSSLKNDSRRLHRVPFKPANENTLIEEDLLLRAQSVAKQKQSLIKDQLVKINQHKQLLPTKIKCKLNAKSTPSVQADVNRLRSDEKLTKDFELATQSKPMKPKSNNPIKTEQKTRHINVDHEQINISNQHRESSAAVTKKLEELPKLEINKTYSQIQLGKLILGSSVSKISSIDRPLQRRASISEGSSPVLKERPARRPSCSEPSIRKSELQFKLETTDNENKESSIVPVDTKSNKTDQNIPNRLSLNFDLSESVVEFLQMLIVCWNWRRLTNWNPAVMPLKMYLKKLQAKSNSNRHS
ncbi:protein teflon isoform X2 [Drosophila hydei]|uniref:Protein teflon isoform X2 n=1 Tax=Drosophila hydei TaxID=7224 RepID=A0A6J1L2Z4_DROHY|nr:protein teflon isoform X2 [Drosophila hydei]